MSRFWRKSSMATVLWCDTVSALAGILQQDPTWQLGPCWQSCSEIRAWKSTYATAATHDPSAPPSLHHVIRRTCFINHCQVTGTDLPDIVPASMVKVVEASNMWVDASQPSKLPHVMSCVMQDVYYFYMGGTLPTTHNPKIHPAAAV